MGTPAISLIAKTCLFEVNSNQYYDNKNINLYIQFTSFLPQRSFLFSLWAASCLAMVESNDVGSVASVLTSFSDSEGVLLSGGVLEEY